jgi:hypothetical protein
MTPSAALLAFLLACSGEAPAPAETVVAPPPPAPTAAEADVKEALVPSATETQNALEDAGVDVRMADLLVQRAEKLGENPDEIAVRTGVHVSDLLLTIRSGEKSRILAELDAVRSGLAKLGAGGDIDTMLGEARARFENDAVTREEMLHDMEQLASATIPELDFNGQARVVPLIQAGSWLEGTHLVALALQKSGNVAAADRMLKQPIVVGYFLKYVREEGADKAPAEVTEKLEASLKALEGIASKAEPLTAADVDAVVKTTEDVLALL